MSLKYIHLKIIKFNPLIYVNGKNQFHKKKTGIKDK
jgi:hypothetical protein